MARKSFGDYPVFLLKVIEFWPQLGPNFSVANWDLARVTAENEEMKVLNQRIQDLELELGRARWERDKKALAIADFSKRFRATVIGSFPSGSVVFASLPSLMQRGPGRPNKSAATLKANTLKRKLAAQAAKNPPS